uniref:DsbA family protein n=1 Tax=Jannaschia maritima TaxID=3032585 RepID=UPI002810CECE
MPTRRRDLLAAVLAVGGGYAVLRGASDWIAGEDGGPRFEPMDAPAGFRRLRGGALTAAAFDPFVGIADDGAPRPDPTLVDALRRDPCAALFDPGPAPGRVPVAIFTDYNCAVCRVETRELAARAEGPDAAIDATWHELPLLGESSVLAARAALAAALQGAYLPFHRRVMGSAFRPTPAHLAQVARDLGLDGDRLARDMDGPAVGRRLAATRALA